MITYRVSPWPVALLAALVAAPLAAQEPVPDSVSAAPDTTPRKKGGLFGTVKKVAANKAVQAVAKTAACTMVPGGQVIAGAIDAADSKSAREAASGAAAAATGNACMPGMGAAGLAGAPAAGLGAGVGPLPAGAGGLAGMAAAGMAAGAMPGGSMRGMPMGYAPAMAGGAGLQNSEGLDATAACLGLSPEGYRDLIDPTRGEARGPTKDEAKRQQRAATKMDPQRYQRCLMAGMPADDEGDR